MSNQLKCVICLDNFKTKKKLNCNHKFCSECIAINLIHSNNCPLCRKDIKIKCILNIINSTSLTKKREKTENNKKEILNIFQFFMKMTNKSKVNKKKIINKIYLLAFNNLWYLEDNTKFREILLKKLYEFDNSGWKKAKYWINKFDKN